MRCYGCYCAAMKKRLNIFLRQSWGDITHETRENYYFIRADGRAISVFFENKNVTDFRFDASCAEWGYSIVPIVRIYDCGGLAYRCGHRRLNNVKRENVGYDGNDNDANRCLRQKKICALGWLDDADWLKCLKCLRSRVKGDCSRSTVHFN